MYKPLPVRGRPKCFEFHESSAKILFPMYSSWMSQISCSMFSVMLSLSFTVLLSFVVNCSSFYGVLDGPLVYLFLIPSVIQLFNWFFVLSWKEWKNTKMFVYLLYTRPFLQFDVQMLWFEIVNRKLNERVSLRWIETILLQLKLWE